MKKNFSPGKFSPHHFPKKDWFYSVEGKAILPRKKGAEFIVFEGLDGSGQSTQAGLLRDFLSKKNLPVLLTKEPTLDSKAGKKIRQILDKKINVEPQELQELFAKDRKEHLEKLIIPALKEGKIVISDRYFFSSLAYGVGSGLDLDWLIKLNSKFLLPNLTFILKVSPEVCLQRIRKRNTKRTLFEEKETLAKVWQTYKILPAHFENVYPVRDYGNKKKLQREQISNGVYMIDGEKSIENVFSQIKKISLQK